jgi:hypothetical protein
VPAWSFRSEFHAPLANGLAQANGDPPPFPGIRPKRQTIRAIRRDGRDPLPGVEMGVWLDMRTPHRIYLGPTPPLRTRAAIRIPHPGDVQVEGLGTLAAGDVTKLARRDGFRDAAGLFEFIRKAHGFPFAGYRFRW